MKHFGVTSDILEDRFKIDKELLLKIDPFIKFEKTTNTKQIYLLIAPDLELANLFLQFQDISNRVDILAGKSLNETIIYLSKTETSRETYKE